MLALGVDVGGSKASLGIVDVATGAVLDSMAVPTPPLAQADARFLADVAEAARGLAARAGAAAPLPAGIGICEVVETDSQIVSAYRVRWTTDGIRAAFSFATSVAVEADIRAAATAEALFGAGRGLGHWIYANAGTGIATVLMSGDRPFCGAHGRGVAAGMGPASLADGAAPSIEDLAGGAGMLARAEEAGLLVRHVADLLEQAQAGNTVATAIVSQGGGVLGRMLGLLANALDPQAIVVGGGIAAASPDFVTACRAAFFDSVWYKDGVPGMPTARLGADSGLIGAAVFASRVMR